MSSFRVLDIGESLTSRRREFLKRSAAQYLLRVALAEKIAPGIIRRLLAKLPQPRTIRPQYIPEKMPPREAPGCYFQLPQSDTWKEQHRTVSFMQHF